MARYFMGDTRLAGLERMMMDPSRSPSTRTDTRKKRPQKKLPCKIGRASCRERVLPPV